MKQLILIRHGKTEGNLRRLYYGSTDLPLCPEGIRELEALTSVYQNLEAATYRTSGMKRTEQTLELLFGQVPYESDPRFREMDFGSFEMKNYEELRDQDAYQRWISGDNESNRTPGGESGELVRLRVLAGLEDLLKEEANTILITHGGVIALIMAQMFPGEGKNRYQWQPPCGKGYVLNRVDSGWSYRAL